MNIAGKARALAVAAVVCGAPVLFGQATSGTLIGTVTDPTGAAIPNATVVVTDTNKGTSSTVTTNGSGDYTVEHLIPDTYSIKISANGFTNFETTGVTIAADTAPRIDAHLTIGSSGETVSVSATELPLLNTDKADVATVFDEKNVADLPLPNRNFTGLQLLLPGAQVLGWSHASSENPQGSQQIMIDGQSFAGVGYELDGTDNQDPILGIIVINPTVDSVAEAKITTQNYDAQFGKAVSAVITTQTKSGSNALHGGAYWFRQSDAQNAKNPFNTPDPVTKLVVAPGLRSQFGGYLGGPIIKDKAFFFFDYEGVRQSVGTSTGLLSVPTNLLRSSCLSGNGCDFSDYINGSSSALGRKISNGIFNPATGARYANNVIPNAQINQTALNLLMLLPTPTDTANADGNFSRVGTGSFNYNEFTVRLDEQVSARAHAFGRYSYYTNVLSGGTAFGALGGSGFGPGNFGGSSKGHNQSLALGVDFVVTPKWLTDVRFGFFRYAINTQKYDGNEQFATIHGLPGLNTTQFANTGGAPLFTFDGFTTDNNNHGGANFGSGLGTNSCNCALTEDEHEYQIVNNWTHELGNHTIKFGVDYRHAFNLRVPSDNNRTGELNALARNTGDTSGANGLSYASFLIGNIGTFNRYASNVANATENQNRLFLYAQDVWRVTSKLTINYGLRWENYFPETAKTGEGASLNLATGNLQVAGMGPYGGAMGVSNAWKAFAPRVGVAYSYDNKTVIRAGYGRSFDIGVFGSIFGHNVTQNLPVLAKQNTTSSGYGYAYQIGGAVPAPNFGGAIVNGNLALPNGIAANGRPTTERFPTIDAWNVEVQRDLGHQYNITVAYVGNKGTHTFAGDSGNVNPNEVREVYNGLAFNPTSYTGNQPLAQYCIGAPNPNLPCSGANDPRRRLYNPIFGWTQDLNYFNNGNDTHYNSFQMTLDKRFSGGYQFKVNYAHQVATNYQQDYVTVQKATAYGNQDDLRHDQMTFFGNLELPFGRGKQYLSNSSLWNEVLGGFQISPTMNLASGLPWWPGYQNCGNDRDNGPCTPNYNGSGFSQGLYRTTATGAYQVSYYTPVPTIGRGYNSGPFTEPNFLTFGNTRRNSFFGPYVYTADLAVQKAFPIKERVNLQFRTDFYNVFNHMAYATPNATVDSSSGGQITQLAPGVLPRRIQFAFQIKF